MGKRTIFAGVLLALACSAWAHQDPSGDCRIVSAGDVQVDACVTTSTMSPTNNANFAAGAAVTVSTSVAADTCYTGGTSDVIYLTPNWSIGVDTGTLVETNPGTASKTTSGTDICIQYSSPVSATWTYTSSGTHTAIVLETSTGWSNAHPGTQVVTMTHAHSFND